MEQVTKDDRTAPGGDRKAKKAYQKPAFRYERVFETMALICSKVSTTQAQCKFNTKNS